MAAYTYRIHPAIGVARVGNSEAFYLGPETMAGLPVEGNSTTTGGLPIKPGTASYPTGEGTEIHIGSTVKDVKDGQLGAQRYSVRGVGTASPNPANQGRYQDYLNMVKNFHQIGVVIQGTAIDSSDGGPFDQGYYPEVQSQLDDSGDPVTPWPMKVSE